MARAGEYKAPTRRVSGGRVRRRPCAPKQFHCPRPLRDEGPSELGHDAADTLVLVHAQRPDGTRPPNLQFGSRVSACLGSRHAASRRTHIPRLHTVCASPRTGSSRPHDAAESPHAEAAVARHPVLTATRTNQMGQDRAGTTGTVGGCRSFLPVRTRALLDRATLRRGVGGPAPERDRRGPYWWRQVRRRCSFGSGLGRLTQVSTADTGMTSGPLLSGPRTRTAGKAVGRARRSPVR